MRRVMLLVCILSTFMGYSLRAAANDTFVDYQNYNHGYCPSCSNYPCQCNTGYEPCATCPYEEEVSYPEENCSTCSQRCDPEAPRCRSSFGVSCCAIAIAIIAVVIAAVIIVSSGNGAASSTETNQ